MPTELSIEKLVWRGRGLCRLPGGKVVLLQPGGLPGERVLAEVIKSRKGHAEAVITAVLDPSPQRRPHPCPHSEACGGSRFGVIRDQAQQRIKRDMLAEVLARFLPGSLGGDLGTALTVTPSPEQWRYRWRAQVHVQGGRPHYRQGASHDLVALNTCHLLAPELEHGILGLCADAPDGRCTFAASPFDSVVRMSGDPEHLLLDYRDFPLQLMAPASSFFQANWGCNQLLVRHVLHHLGDFTRVADLFAGVGNFALPLAFQKKEVLAAEADAAAVDAAGKAGGAAGLTTLSTLRLDLGQAGNWGPVRGFRPEALVVDPPRVGGGKAVQRILEIAGLRRIVWVSCDAVNSCRDLKPFLDNGWDITDCAMFDMFPQTWHMEAVFVLDRPA